MTGAIETLAIALVTTVAYAIGHFMGYRKGYRKGYKSAADLTVLATTTMAKMLGLEDE